MNRATFLISGDYQALEDHVRDAVTAARSEDPTIAPGDLTLTCCSETSAKEQLLTCVFPARDRAQFLVLEKHLSRAALLSSCRFSSEFCPCFDVDRFKHDALTTSGPAILQEFMLGSVLELSDKGVRAEDILAYLSHASDYVSRLVDTTSRMYLREHASPN